tara:strand:+ start:78 stop:281 length:204 start_codon:yes stop_codon:yes gene_type:complete
MKVYIYILEQDLELLYKALANIEAKPKNFPLLYVSSLLEKQRKDWINLSLNVDDFTRLKDNNILKKL